MGAQQGGLLAIGILQETSQGIVKISCKSPEIAFVSNSPRKHRQGLGKETAPWNVACMQITSQSLSRLLPPSHSLESSSSKVICAGPCCQISARKAVKFVNLDFPSVFQTPIKYKSILPEITPLFVWRYSTLHSAPLSYHSQPFTLTDNHPICTVFYMATNLTLRSTSFQPPTHKGPSENSLLCSTSPVFDVAGEVDLSTLSKGSWEMKSLPPHVSVNWHVRRGLSTLQQGLSDNATEVKDSVPYNQSPFGTILLLL